MTSFQCILCGGTEAPGRVDSPKFRDGGHERHQIATCGTCGHVQLHPLMTLEDEHRYYSTDSQPKQLFGHDDYHDILRAKARPETARRLAWLRSAVAPGKGVSTLDVGSGYGFYVDALCEAGYDAHGLEVSDERLVSARKLRGTFHQSQADEAFVAQFRGRFDAVTSFHCVEHLRDPVIYVRDLGRMVKPGGVMLLEVPNLTDELMEIPEYAVHQWQVCHYSYFDKARFELLLLRAGFRDYSVEGVQRYDLRHLRQWTDLRAPDLTDGGKTGTSALFERMDALYRRDREQRLSCDTLIATVRL
jgi:SAM-dependent methyltransferase